MSKGYRPLRLTDVFKFGKYKDGQVEDIIYDDPGYMAWCVNESVVSFDEEVMRQLEEMKII
jgi:hypothetical protein